MSILLTLLLTREWMAKLLLQMLLLLCLEFAVDNIKIHLCERRGIPVRHIRPKLRGNMWFVLALVSFGTAAVLGSICGRRADCYLFGPQ